MSIVIQHRFTPQARLLHSGNESPCKVIDGPISFLHSVELQSQRAQGLITVVNDVKGVIRVKSPGTTTYCQCRRVSSWTLMACPTLRATLKLLIDQPAWHDYCTCSNNPAKAVLVEAESAGKSTPLAALLPSTHHEMSGQKIRQIRQIQQIRHASSQHCSRSNNQELSPVLSHPLKDPIS